MPCHAFRAVAAAACLILSVAGAFAADPPRPNILWISCEDTSPWLGFCGEPYARTPHLDRLAAQSVYYRNVFATSPVCSPCRYSIITSTYSTSYGAQHLRTEYLIPSAISRFPRLLREAGYYCSNNYKADYNSSYPAPLGPAEQPWDEQSKTAHWRNRPPGKPFFAVFNLMESHQSRTFTDWSADDFRPEASALHDPSLAPLPPYYPDTPEARRTIARVHDTISAMDRHAGSILTDLERDGLSDDTIIFFWSDHGQGIPRGKRTPYDTGLRAPMLVYFPEKYRHLAPAPPGGVCDRMVSLVDLGPTMLSLLELPIPSYMQGRAFLGKQAAPPRQYVFGARDRVDEAIDLSRSARDARWLYIRNFMPHRSWNQPEWFSDQLPLRREIARLAADGRLDPPAMTYAAPTRPVEELYDTQSDPWQVHNLAGDPAHAETLSRMRQALKEWMIETRDTGLIPEWEMVRMAGASTTIHQAACDDRAFPVQRVVEAAWRVGSPEAPRQALSDVGDANPIVRFWAIAGLRGAAVDDSSARAALRAALADSSAAVRIEAAGILAEKWNDRTALDALVSLIPDAYPPPMLDQIAGLYAARMLQMLGPHSRPVLPALRRKLAKVEGPETLMFLRWSLETLVGQFGSDESTGAVESAAPPHGTPAAESPITAAEATPTADAAPAPRADESVVYVSPRGDDARSGQRADVAADGRDGPVASLARAVELARGLRRNGAPRRIVVLPGEYFVDRTIVLGPDDSDLTIEASDPAAPPTFVGGRTLRNWRADGEHFVAVDLPEVKSGQWDFRALIVGGKLRPRARLPREGVFEHETDFPVPWMSSTGGGWKRKPTEEELTTMRYREGDLGEWLETKNAEITVFHMWDESVTGVASIDPSARRLRFSAPCGHPPGAFGVKKYVVWNVREGMTEPGQWHLDRAAGKVVYWPLPGEDMGKTRTVAPTLQTIIRLAGQKDKPVRRVTLRSLRFEATNTPLVAGGFGAGNFPGAVEMFHAEDCRLTGLEIANVAGQGVKASELADCSIEGCHVHDVGACGIKFTGRCDVRRCQVHHNGRIYPSGIAVWGGGSGGKICRIEHNTIHDTPYSAVVCGGDDHRIEHNRIFRAMQVLHDGAGIYVGFGKRMVLRGNWIHDIVDTGGYGASAYYLDEQAEDCVVEGNLSVRVARPSHNHMARRNTIRGNVFVCDGDASITFPRSADFTLENNVVVAGGSIRLSGIQAVTAAKNNLLFSRAGKVEGIELRDYGAAGSRPIESGDAWRLEDPKLLEFDAGLVRFAADSPATALGIAPLDVRGAGP